MEKNWERTLPFLKINREITENLFRGVLNKDDIITIEPIDEGCRTSNYIITTIDNKRYLLKIFLSYEQKYKKECKILNDILKNKIPVQEICKFDRSNIIENRYYVIYEYVEGITLSQFLNDGDIISKNIIREIAHTLANIHKLKFKYIGFLDEDLSINNKLKPLNQWYNDFLTHRVEERLGQELTRKIKLLINDYKEQLIILDNDSRLVHGDFQCTNILVNNNKLSGIIDWEFAMAGHPISDIGQFFRYEEYFNENLISLFEDEYRKKSDYILPENWYKLCKVRDLANLVQLLGFEENMPNKYREIKTIIMKTLEIC